MESRPHSSDGFLSSLRGLGDTLIGSVQDRLELFSAELQEEKLRLLQVLIWISAVVFAGAMTLTFASILVVYLFWESARIGVLAGLTVFYATALVALALSFRSYLSRQAKPFSDTLQELNDDRVCMRNTN
ncbi:MAG TPA: phage holin family protein [Rariglobus sp.]|jgi:uncharacterized membrane protein YqjE|nr:phage holin family protein [Rariglobus sp.]